MKNEIFNILSIVFALALVLSFSLVPATPAGANGVPNPTFATVNVAGFPTLTTPSDEISIKWERNPTITGGAYSGTDAIHVTTSVATLDYAMVTVPTNFTLATDTPISYWGYTVSDNVKAPDEIYLFLDMNSSGTFDFGAVDILLTSHKTGPVASAWYGKWHEWNSTDSTDPSVSGHNDWHIVDPTTGYTPITDLTPYQGYTVLAIALTAGPSTTSGAVNVNVYFDQLTVDGVALLDDDTGVIDVPVPFAGLPAPCIQDAVNAALPGDTVNVAAGTYNEQVFIDESLTLLGAKAGVDARTRDTTTGESILDGTGLAPVVGVGAFNIADGVSDVTIDGFEVCNYQSINPGGGSAVLAYSYGGAIQGLSRIAIQNNYLHDLGWNGVCVWSNNTVVQEDFTIQFNLIEEAPYAGIELTNVTNSQVLNNKIIAPTAIVHDPGDAGVGIEIAVRAQPGITISGGNVLVEGNEITGAFPAGPTEGISRAGINILSRTYNVTSSATLTGVTVRGNTVSGGGANVRAGILAVAESRSGGPATINNLLIEDNILNGYHDGIMIEQVGGGTYNSLAITGNDFSNNNVQLTDDTETLDIATILNNNTFDRAVTVDRPTGSLLHTIWSKIQDGIEAALASDNVNVAAGTYDEQVVINKSLTLQGAGDTTVIQPAGPELTVTASIPWIGSTKPMSAIVSVETTGDEVTIRDLKIDGSLITSKSTLWVGGLVYLETSGTVEGVTVIGNPALPDRTAGIFAAAVTQTSLVEVTGCNVIGYNRAGIYALGAEFTADYHHNVINGPGSISTGVPNGMFFLEGANGSATYNTVTDLFYTGEEYRSTGIGTYNAGSDVTFAYNTISNVQNAFALSNGTSGTIVEYNDIFNNHTGVRLESGAQNSIIRCNDIHDNDFAIRCGATMGDGNEAHYNNFVNNPGVLWVNVKEAVPNTYVGAVCNVHETFILNAIRNWWGDASGPGPVGPGAGDKVSANVLYDPWLSQQWSNQVWVDDDYTPATPGWDADHFAEIQTAINAVPPGTTVNVAAGEYIEDLTIEKSLTIQGAGAGVTSITGNMDTIVGINLDGETVVFDGFTVFGEPYLIALTAVNGSSVTIEDNEIYNGMDGINFHPIMSGSELTIQNNNNILLYYGIYLNMVSGGSAVTIQNNNIHGNGEGILLNGVSEDSTVAITGNDITNNVMVTSGIHLGPGVDATSVRVNFNNIFGNVPYGVYNSTANNVNAKNNWWGDASGPGGFGPGTGDSVSARVLYDPWLTIPVIGAKTATVGAGETLDATSGTGTSVGVTTGSATITVAKYSGNPSTSSFGASTGQYIDIHLANVAPIPGAEIVIKLYYTDADIAGKVESSLRLCWWDGAAWVVCSGPLPGDWGVNTADILVPPAPPPAGAPYSGFMFAKIRSEFDANATTPTLEQLIGTPFGGGGAAAAVGGGGGGGGGGGLTLPTLRGLVSEPPMRLDAEGALTIRCVLQTTDGKLTLDIARYTRLLDSLRRPLTSLSAELDPSLPAPPPGAAIILAYNFGPEGAVFLPVITMTMAYDPTTFTEDIAEQSLYIAYWDGSKWVALETTVDTMTRTASCQVSHLSIFALIGAVTAPPAAAFSVSSLSIYPLKVEPNDAVAITVSVANTGGAEGSYSVALKINGVMEAEESVTVAPGGSQSVGFSVTMEEAGSYSVDVNGLAGSFTVAAAEALPEAPIQIAWWIWVIIGVVVVGLAIFFIVRRMAY